MYACNFFPDSKTAYHIQVAIDKILSEIDLDTSNTPCTTDKGSNMVGATSTKCHINCACHHLVWLLKAKNGQYLEINGIKVNLVPLDAEFSAE